jgi:ribonuclease HII
VAAAVVFAPGQLLIEGLRDSKAMTALARARVAEAIRACAIGCSLGAASVKEIDRLNIKRATALAMRRAITNLPFNPDHILVDGNPLPDLGMVHEAVVGGDRESQSIAAAAVVAKCTRDRLMRQLASRYPAFGWEDNKGYGTRDHIDVLDSEGPTPHHRRSFAPVLQPGLGLDV